MEMDLVAGSEADVGGGAVLVGEWEVADLVDDLEADVGGGAVLVRE
jgi:hypothetical protein